MSSLEVVKSGQHPEVRKGHVDSEMHTFSVTDTHFQLEVGAGYDLTMSFYDFVEGGGAA